MPRRTLLVALAVIAGIAAVGLALFSFSTSTSAPEQITYQGQSYGNMVKVSQIEVRAHVGVLHPVNVRIDGKAVYVSAGPRPQVVALVLSPGEFDAYQLGG